MQQAKVSNDYSDLFVCIANWKEVVIYLHRERLKKIEISELIRF